jgi:hypothetical protein
MKVSLVGTVFDGSAGQRKIEPSEGARGVAVTASQASRMIQSFLSAGMSRHSEAGMTRWVIIHYCEVNKLPYKAYENSIELLDK